MTHKSEAFDVSVDRATTGINAGCFKPAYVEGVVFSDKNTNSIQEGALESLLPLSVRFLLPLMLYGLCVWRTPADPS